MAITSLPATLQARPSARRGTSATRAAPNGGSTVLVPASSPAPVAESWSESSRQVRTSRRGICVVEKVRSQVGLRRGQSRRAMHGKASIEFERKAGFDLVTSSISQTPVVRARPVHAVGDRAHASGQRRARGGYAAPRRCPPRSNGTTVGATRDPTDPSCIDGENTVWYRLDRAEPAAGWPSTCSRASRWRRPRAWSKRCAGSR